MSPMRPSFREDFKVAIICALPLEYDAITLVFDEFWDDNGDEFGKVAEDPNNYLTGRIGKHNVVLVLLPHMGKVKAASAMAHTRTSYRGIQLVISAGICGGVPCTDTESEMILGDVVISSKVVQYDLGRQYPDKFVRRETTEDNLGKQNKDIRNLLVTFETELGRERLQARSADFLKLLQTEAVKRKRRAKYMYLGVSEDRLFKADYRHMHRATMRCTCRQSSVSNHVCEAAVLSACEDLGCNSDYLVSRQRLLEAAGEDVPQAPDFAIHIGSIASGDTVMKDGERRDTISAREGVIAFETEGAGLWEEAPSIVIKGVCDYSDSHKNKRWQNYAAATAAATVKAVLERYIHADDVTDGHSPDKAVLTQGGSRFSADVVGQDIKQGNELEITSMQLRDYLQEGSSFEGSVRAESSVQQGNKLTI